MLSESQIDLIRQSAERLADASSAATDAFYTSLFRAAPGIRPLFPEDMFEQGEKLWDSIVMIVESADQPGAIRDTLKALGARHVEYGAEPAHYELVARVLIETVSLQMPDHWTDAHQQAWQTALDAVCAIMIEGSVQRAA